MANSMHISREKAIFTDDGFSGSTSGISLCKAETGTVACGSDAVIVGGQELAGQAFAQAQSLGAKTVTFVFRDSPDEATVSALTGAGAVVFSNAVVTRLFGDGELLTGIEVKQEGKDDEKVFIGSDSWFFFNFNNFMFNRRDNKNRRGRAS